MHFSIVSHMCVGWSRSVPYTTWIHFWRKYSHMVSNAFGGALGIHISLCASESRSFKFKLTCAFWAYARRDNMVSVYVCVYRLSVVIPSLVFRTKSFRSWTRHYITHADIRHNSLISDVFFFALHIIWYVRSAYIYVFSWIAFCGLCLAWTAVQRNPFIHSFLWLGTIDTQKR